MKLPADLDRLDAKGLRALLKDKSPGTYSYETGVAIRGRLHFLGRMNYEAQNRPKEYMEFLTRNECSFKRVGAQQCNPAVWELFTVVSQHVYGDTVEECLDKAMTIERRKQ